MSGACGKRGGKVLKLFKKPLSLNGSLPSFKIAGKNECNFVVSIRGFFVILPEKSGYRNPYLTMTLKGTTNTSIKSGRDWVSSKIRFKNRQGSNFWV